MKKGIRTLIKGVGGLLILSFSLVATAQQDPMYTQYMFNTLSVNPGYAGSRGVLNASGLLRAQWIGIEGAPLTQTFFVHGPLLSKKMGIGLSVVNDRIGPINQTLFFADYSYTVKVSDEAKLSLGLKAGFNLIQGRLTQLNTTEPSDNVFVQDVQHKAMPNFGFGAYYHSPAWYLGISIPKLMQNKIEGELDYSKVSEKRHYFLIAGFVYKINENVKFKPTMLTKVTSGAPVSIDVTAHFLFREKLWLGAGYRIKESFSVLAEIQLNPQLRCGYAYDFPISDLRTYNSGSHEILLSYDFRYNNDKILSPRYF